MPKTSAYKNAIARFYRRGVLDVSLFNWVSCTRSLFPTVSIEESLRGWYKFYQINEDDYSIKTASQTFFRMQEELLYKNKDEKDNKLVS